MLAAHPAEPRRSSIRSRLRSYRNYMVSLDHRLKSLSPEEYTAYRERTHTKHKNMNMNGGPDPKIVSTDL